VLPSPRRPVLARMFWCQMVAREENNRWRQRRTTATTLRGFPVSIDSWCQYRRRHCDQASAWSSGRRGATCSSVVWSELEKCPITHLFELRAALLSQARRAVSLPSSAMTHSPHIQQMAVLDFFSRRILSVAAVPFRQREAKLAVTLNFRRQRSEVLECSAH
jgi:hypothetical protein